jgi:hypothetical protein
MIFTLGQLVLVNEAGAIFVVGFECRQPLVYVIVELLKLHHVNCSTEVFVKHPCKK